MSIEEMEIKRNDLFHDYLNAIGTADEKAKLNALNLMDEILDAMEGYEAEESLNTSTNWDEWYIDHRIDLDREDRMLYER